MTLLGSTGWTVSPLCLGTNVFGWTADERESFGVLDAYIGAGGNFIDTADQYAAFAPGHHGGEAEVILGRWFTARRNRDRVLLATKVGRKPGLEGLRPATIRKALEESLRRLQTDYVDLLYAHADDPDTPQEDTLATFDELIRIGSVRQIAASNFSAPRLKQAIEISERNRLAQYVALQSHYSLVERSEFEGALQDLCVSVRVPCIPYWGLARGFLTGKYRPGGEPVASPRARAASAHLDDRGLRILGALDEVAANRGVPVAAVALAWLAAQPAVISPVASARTPKQLADLLLVGEVALSAQDLSRLTAASEL